MPEEKQEESNIKALNIDVRGIIKKHPDVSSVNVFYEIVNDEVQLKGMEIIPVQENVN